MHPHLASPALQAIVDSFDARQQLFATAHEDPALLQLCRSQLEPVLRLLIDELLDHMVRTPEVARLLAQTDAGQLHAALCRHVLQMFAPQLDAHYAQQRLQVGLLHKHRGVEPSYFLAAIQHLHTLLHRQLHSAIKDEMRRSACLALLERRLMLDTSLVIDAYLHSLLQELQEGRERLERYAEEMASLSRTDPLTGLLNVRDMKEEFSRMLASAARHQEPVTAIYIDINDFKQVNDRFGHERGDAVLRAVGAAMRQVSRSDDRCFRCGGDEFCMLLENCTAADASSQLLPRLHEQLQQQHPDISLSCGVAQSGPLQHIDGHQLIRLADQRMYRAKRQFKQQRASAQSTESNSSSCGGPR